MKSSLFRQFSTSANRKPTLRARRPYVPVRANAVTAVVLLGFVGSIYYYTIRQVKQNSLLGPEFDEPAHSALKVEIPEVEKPTL